MISDSSITINAESSEDQSIVLTGDQRDRFDELDDAQDADSVLVGDSATDWSDIDDDAHDDEASICLFDALQQESQSDEAALNQSDDGWGGRYFCADPVLERRGHSKRRRHETMRKIWSKMKAAGMNANLDDFLEMNCAVDASGSLVQSDKHYRPTTYHDKAKTDRRWVNIPTQFGDVDGNNPVVVKKEEEKSDSDEIVIVGDEADDSDGSSVTIAIENPQDSDEVELDRGDSGVLDSPLPDTGDVENDGANSQSNEGESKTEATDAEHNAKAFAVFRKFRRSEFKDQHDACKDRSWFKDASRKHGLHAGPIDETDTEGLLTEAEAYLSCAAMYAGKAPRVGKNKQRRNYRRGKQMYALAAALVLLAVANLVQGMEGIKARDVPEPKTFKDALDSEWWKCHRCCDTFERETHRRCCRP